MWKNIYTNSKQKSWGGYTNLTLNRIYIKKPDRDKKVHYILIKVSIHQRDTICMFICNKHWSSKIYEGNVNRIKGRNWQLYNYSGRLQYIMFLAI